MQRKYTVHGNGQATTGEGREQPATEDVLESLFLTGGGLISEHQELLEQSLVKSMQQAALKYGTPGEGKIRIRRDGPAECRRAMHLSPARLISAPGLPRRAAACLRG